MYIVLVMIGGEGCLGSTRAEFSGLVLQSALVALCIGVPYVILMNFLLFVIDSPVLMRRRGFALRFVYTCVDIA